MPTCCIREKHVRNLQMKTRQLHASYRNKRKNLVPYFIENIKFQNMPSIQLATCTQRRRLLIACLLLIELIAPSAACTSRAIPKPRPTEPTETTTARPNITFPIFKCPSPYAAWYCLNDATCFTVEIHNEVLYNCECANGFMGPRCEYKEIDGSYLPTRQRAMLETASIASGATLALLVMIMLCLMLYIRHEKQQKQKLNESAVAHENEGMDEVDGMTLVPEMRPFGQHHYQILPLAAAFKR